jgi:hypothetical protein
MFVVLLRLADGSSVSEHLDGHRLRLQRGFDDNVFMLTGGIPQRGGGAIIAAGLSQGIEDAARGGSIHRSRRRNARSGRTGEDDERPATRIPGLQPDLHAYLLRNPA